MKKLIPLCALFSLVGCKVTKLAEQTKANTEKVLEFSGTTHQQMRSGNSSAARDEEITKIKDESNDMGVKIAAASKFYKAFEFQLWTNNGIYDDARKREHLYMDAVLEFFKLMADFHANVADDLAKDKISAISLKTNDEKIFYSMALGMHLTHQYQDDQSERRNFPVVSFYDLMKAALLKDARGEVLKDYEMEFVVAANKKICMDLLKARQDMLLALGLKNLVSKEDMSTLEKLSAVSFNLSGGSLGKISMESKFLTANKATKKDINKKIEGAAKVRRFTDQLGVELPIDKKIASILANLKYKNIGDDEKKSDVDLSTMASRDSLLKEHLDLINEVLSIDVTDQSNGEPRKLTREEKKEKRKQKREARRAARANK
jgi:hypothetical protein